MSAANAPEPWTEHALCAQVGGDLFFPEPAGASAREAKSVCRGCSVTDECLQYAVNHHIREGVWGGLTPSQRRGMRAAA